MTVAGKHLATTTLQNADVYLLDFGVCT